MTDVEIYASKQEGPALAVGRPLDLEDEIREVELLQQRDAALILKLQGVVDKCDFELARLRCKRTIPFPLMTPEEVRVWKAFLPTTYKVFQPGVSYWQERDLKAYVFDIPPVSVLRQWVDLAEKQMFDEYEVWTPERPMPEPILAGYKTFDKKSIGPFLIARWGESLEPFEAIREKVDSRTATAPTLQFINSARSFPNALAISTTTGSLGSTFTVPGGDWGSFRITG